MPIAFVLAAPWKLFLWKIQPEETPTTLCRWGQKVHDCKSKKMNNNSLVCQAQNHHKSNSPLSDDELIDITPAANSIRLRTMASIDDSSAALAASAGSAAAPTGRRNSPQHNTNGYTRDFDDGKWITIIRPPFDCGRVIVVVTLKIFFPTIFMQISAIFRLWNSQRGQLEEPSLLKRGKRAAKSVFD